MALANGNGGFQIGTGNPSDAVMWSVNFLALTGDTTLTAAQLVSSVVTCNKGSDAGLTVTSPTAALIDAHLPNAKVGSCFEVVINNDNDSGASSTVTFEVGTGVKLYGSDTVARHGSAVYYFVKTAAGAWSAFLV